MSSKSKGQKGAFGGLTGKRKKAQVRYLVDRKLKSRIKPQETWKTARFTNDKRYK